MSLAERRTHESWSFGTRGPSQPGDSCFGDLPGGVSEVRVQNSATRGVLSAFICPCLVSTVLLGCAARLDGSVKVEGDVSVNPPGSTPPSTTETTVLIPGVERRGDHICFDSSGGEPCYGASINFKTDSAKITGEESQDTLGKILELLQSYPKVKLEIGGHTDSRGPASYNRKLSGERAQSVVRWLVKNGVERDRLAYKGYGETGTEAIEQADGTDCHNLQAPRTKADECGERWKLARRAELKIVAGAETMPDASAPPPPPPGSPPPAAPVAEKEEPKSWVHSGPFFYLGPGFRTIRAPLDRSDNGVGATFLPHVGGGYMWHRPERSRLLLTLGGDLEVGVPYLYVARDEFGETETGVSARLHLAPTLRVGAAWDRVMLYGRLSPGLLISIDDSTRPGFGLGAALGVGGMVTRRFFISGEFGPDIDLVNGFATADLDAKLLFGWLF